MGTERNHRTDPQLTGGGTPRSWARLALVGSANQVSRAVWGGRQRRGQLAAVAVGLLVCVLNPVALGQATGGHIQNPEAVAAHSHGLVAGKVKPPTTPFQCKKKFRPRSKARRACIKLVESQKPGSSCKHPLFSAFAVDGASSQGSDLKDFTVKFKLDRRNKSGERGESITFHAEVIVSNPRLVMCRLVVAESKGGGPRGRNYPLSIGPHGGLSSQLTLPAGTAFGIIGYARLG
jgi:hypothetical protein